MECGCLRANGSVQSMAKIDRFSATQEIRYVREIILVRREVVDFGRLRPTRNNARKLNLVCDDRDDWVELQRCWKSIWL